jgi:hypothetical protein
MAYLPLPITVADIEPGGGIVSGMRHVNALKDEQLDRRKKELLLPYAVPTAIANNASKQAYHDLMGPQFLSKLMGNESLLSNMPEAQKKKAVEMVTNSAMSQNPIGNKALSNNDISNQQQFPVNSLLGFFKNLMSEQQGSKEQQQVIHNNLENNQSLPKQQLIQNQISPQQQYDLSSQDKQKINNMKPGESFVVQGNQSQKGENTPAEYGSPPETSFAENQANYGGIVSEGKESGKIRAKNIEDLNNIVFSGQTQQTTLDNLSNILGSKEFEQIRQLPLAGQHELSYYAKEGTPEQQNMIGQYYTLTGNIIKDASRDFAGSFRKGEQTLLQGMKPSPADTVDVARGKTESLSVLNKMLTERSRLTSELMSKYHYNKVKAETIADKQINGNQIRDEIHEKLNPVITIKNKKTGEIRTIPISEARKLIGGS